MLRRPAPALATLALGGLLLLTTACEKSATAAAPTVNTGEAARKAKLCEDALSRRRAAEQGLADANRYQGVGQGTARETARARLTSAENDVRAYC